MTAHRRERPASLVTRFPVVTVLASVLWMGCMHWDLGHPTPGTVDIARPPTVREQRFIEPARPAGERMLMVSSGVFGSIGVRASGAEARGHTTWGGEVTVHLGDEEGENHTDYRDDWPLVPAKSWAASVGWSGRSAAGAATASNPGDLYLEIQRMSEKGAGVAAGPVWNPATGGLGGQATGFVGITYVRATMVDYQAVLQIGLMAKFGLTWAWPR